MRLADIMKIRLNRRHLDGKYGTIGLETQPIRVAYVPENEKGQPEYIFVYPGNIPTAKEEPALYAVPHGTRVEDPLEEIWLHYEKATVILVSQDRDNAFRAEYPETIEDIEALMLEW